MTAVRIFLFVWFPMLRLTLQSLLLTFAWLVIICFSANAVEPLQDRVAAAIEILEDAEERFVVPDPEWFADTQQALREEVERVDANLESHGEEYAAAWKKHLRWPLLTSNLGDVSEVNVEELAWVRRWLYSNRKGLEYPFFAELRVRTEAHLDAAYTFSRPRLESLFREQVANAREQLRQLAVEPNDEHAATLGRTLGWLEQTRQLPEEVAAIREVISSPNAQIVVGKPLLDRVLALLATNVEQSLAVSDRTKISSGLFTRSLTAVVHGMASTQGQIGLELLENTNWVDLNLVYEGKIQSRCRAQIGPVALRLLSTGPVQAITPVQVNLQGVDLSATKANPQVRTRVTGVEADSALLRRISERRAREPESNRQMNSRAKIKAASVLKAEMDDRVAAALEEIRAELSKTRNSLDGFRDVLAPVVREGAAPHWAGVQSTAESVVVNVACERREQIGAILPCPEEVGTADVQARLHVSFFNNMAETIMAGKTFTDTYFMNYGRILHAELPPPLMVHSRAKRWGIVAAKPRPLEISIPAANQFRIQLRMQQVNIGEEQFTGPTIATVNYALVKNDFEEYELVRQSDVELDSSLPEAEVAFLQRKLSAFLAPTLNGGGVALPEGGTLGKLRGLQPAGVFADRNWLVLGIDLPDSLLEAWVPDLGQ